MVMMAASDERSAALETGDIKALQYGRGIAALIVCLFHYEQEIRNQFQVVGSYHRIFTAGHSGVEFFFILSGFIILHAHRKDLNRPDRFGIFYKKRAIRVLPMFWLVFIPFGLAILWTSRQGAITPVKFLLDLFLIPREGVLTLPPAWTLQHELVFYVLFGFLILNQRIGIFVLALWQLSCLIVLVFGLLPEDYLVPATTYFGFFNFGFLFGMGIAILLERSALMSPRRAVLFGAVGLVGLLACFVGEWRFGNSTFPSPALASLIYFCFYSLVIVALLSVENRPRPMLETTLGALGAASYILYIVHQPLFSILNKVLLLPVVHRSLTSMTAFPLAVMVAVAVSLLMHYQIERPALRWLRRRFLPPTVRSSNVGRHDDDGLNDDARPNRGHAAAPGWR